MGSRSQFSAPRIEVLFEDQKSVFLGLEFFANLFHVRQKGLVLLVDGRHAIGCGSLQGFVQGTQPLQVTLGFAQCPAEAGGVGGEGLVRQFKNGHPSLQFTLLNLHFGGGLLQQTRFLIELVVCILQLTKRLCAHAARQKEHSEG